MSFSFERTYTNLPDVLHKRSSFAHFPAPKLLLFNVKLAEELGVDLKEGEDLEEYLKVFSGIDKASSACYIAQAYAGHQFGHFNRLGDGRALLVGEQRDPKGQLFDLQVKGAGPTIYSRRGDGKATLYSMLREYIVAEAMHALAVPTSRSLSVASTGEYIQREYRRPGALLTRVASSHLRVGTFQYASTFVGKPTLIKLLDYAIQRHYANAIDQTLEVKEKAMAFFNLVARNQIRTVVHWLRVGFIHGVMNTDNISISGETIDYGPCAFLNQYEARKVYSSIDREGRYAFSQQGPILMWNLARFYEALLPLMGEAEKAVQEGQQFLDALWTEFEQSKWRMYANKFGVSYSKGIEKKLKGWLQLMEDEQQDYTNMFIVIQNEEYKAEYEKLGVSQKVWEKLRREGAGELVVPKEVNPVLIPRNYLVEEALLNAERGDFNQFNRLLERLMQPYHSKAMMQELQREESTYKTYCGT